MLLPYVAVITLLNVNIKSNCHTVDVLPPALVSECVVLNFCAEMA